MNWGVDEEARHTLHLNTFAPKVSAHYFTIKYMAGKLCHIESLLSIHRKLLLKAVLSVLEDSRMDAISICMYIRVSEVLQSSL